MSAPAAVWIVVLILHSCQSLNLPADFKPTHESPGLSTTQVLIGNVLPQSFAYLHGAACLDGTPPAYYILHGAPQAPWIVFFEGILIRAITLANISCLGLFSLPYIGGGWCFSADDCVSRAKGGGGSSKGYQGAHMDAGGILSPNPLVNPGFSNATMVPRLYSCDP